MRSIISLFRDARPSAPRVLPPLQLSVDGRDFSVALQRRANAKRLTLRIARDGDGAVMTLPPRASRAEAQRFAEKSQSWIATQLASRGHAIAITHGAEIALRGAPHTISLTGKTRGLVHHDEAASTLHVPGMPAHVSRRLTDWLKQEARRDLLAASHDYAGRMGVTVTSVAVRDQKSRWGSCSSTGALSYSWRLVLAPPYVLDYVAAHEVAHLREMNHGPRFWRLVLTHCKDTKRAKDWLKRNGKSLHLVG